MVNTGYETIVYVYENSIDTAHNNKNSMRAETERTKYLNHCDFSAYNGHACIVLMLPPNSRYDDFYACIRNVPTVRSSKVRAEAN